MWKKHHVHLPGSNLKCRHYAYYDDIGFVGTVNTDAEGKDWYCHNWYAEQIAGPFKLLRDAKRVVELLEELD